MTVGVGFRRCCPDLFTHGPALLFDGRSLTHPCPFCCRDLTNVKPLPAPLAFRRIVPYGMAYTPTAVIVTVQGRARVESIARIFVMMTKMASERGGGKFVCETRCVQQAKHEGTTVHFLCGRRKPRATV